jgi:hypothetical protein
VPIALLGRSLTVAIHDPTQRALAIDLESSTGLRVRVVLSTKAEIQEQIRRIYEPVGEENAAVLSPPLGEGETSSKPAI